MNTLTFRPVGLPSGFNYIVSVASVTKSGVSPNTVSISIPSGSYTYSYSSIACGYPNQVSKITVSSNQTVPLTFVKSVTSPCNCQQITQSTSLQPSSIQTYLNYSIAGVFLAAAGIIGYKFYKLK